MDSELGKLLNNTESKDNKIRFAAFTKLLEITDTRVDWFIDVFDDLTNRLESDNSYQRSIGMMLLCNLAKSDKDNLLRRALPDILNLLEDEKFITRRQCIQNIWKIAVAENELFSTIVEALETKFVKCSSENHYNLIRQDIVSALYSIHKNRPDSYTLSRIEKLIDLEDDVALKKKYIKITEK